MHSTDVIIIGAGASGLMCAAQAGKRGRKVVVIDHAPQPGRKILMSGGGRCNFTNLNIDAGHYLSHNPDFCKSALSRYSQWDFLAWLQKHAIAYQEKAQGRLFCEHSARDILDLLLAECRAAGVALSLGNSVAAITRSGTGRFSVHASRGSLECASLVVASGGLSIPAAGATPFGYQVAAQFQIDVWPPRAALVPLTLQPGDRERFARLSGIAVEAQVAVGGCTFREQMLFTHRGLSGPVILQSSLYWQPGAEMIITLLPEYDLFQMLLEKQRLHPKQLLKSALADHLPKRLVSALFASDAADRPLGRISQREFREIAAQLQQWRIKPGGTEGYRTAEVTLGGVDCDALSSRTMEALQVPGLYFTGEVIDVTGHLGGYNLQWAWSSGWCAGQCV